MDIQKKIYSHKYFTQEETWYDYWNLLITQDLSQYNQELSLTYYFMLLGLY